MNRLRGFLPGVVAACAFVVVVLGAAPLAFGERAENRAPARITYVGNTGFLIETAHHKVLIDALYRAGLDTTVPVPPEYRDTLEGAKPPFDGVDLVLATHIHRDHFEPMAVGNYLLNNPKAIFFSTDDTVARLQLAFPEYDQIDDRVSGVQPGARPIDFDVNGIKVEAINMKHFSSGLAVYMFVIEMDGWRFLDVGDAVASRLDFRSYHFHDGDIDVVFLPYWYLVDNVTIEAARQGLKADHLVLTHLPPKDLKPSPVDELGGWDAVVKKAKKTLPGVIFFDKQMDTRTFK